MLGTVIFFNGERHFGRIQPDGGGDPVFVHVSGLADPNGSIKEGDRVEFEMEMQPDKGPKAVQVRPTSTPQVATIPVQTQNCFVVMPYGRTPEEVRWFSGWYKLVIEEGVRAAGFEPILAAAQDRPNAINDEIRAHLAFDPMAVIDLGGITPDAEPNPNVMYELGIRHAFNLPHIIMAWAGQRLPFDISNQRTIMERRDLIDVPVNRERLTKFISEAALGNYYRPMDAVGRVATLEAAERRLPPGSVLGALVEEVRDLRTSLTSPSTTVL
jgi:cold shock CspA family protein